MMKETIAIDLHRFTEMLMGSSSSVQLANGLGLPVSAFFNAPVLLSLKGVISKPKTSSAPTALIVGRHFDLNF
jgi:hypothetical protein